MLHVEVGRPFQQLHTHEEAGHGRAAKESRGASSGYPPKIFVCYPCYLARGVVYYGEAFFVCELRPTTEIARFRKSRLNTYVRTYVL